MAVERARMTDEAWERVKQAFWVAVQHGSDLDDTAVIAAIGALEPPELDELHALIEAHHELSRAAVQRSLETSAPPLVPDRFEVIDRVGTGAFGDVYRVRDRISGAVV